MIPKRSETPYAPDPHVSDLEEAILTLLEAAGIDTETNDAIIKLISAGETKKAAPKFRMCPRCDEIEPWETSCEKHFRDREK